jgi:hypothetical protein
MALNLFDWDLGLVTFSGFDADGFLSVQYDAPGNGEDDDDSPGGVAPYEAHHMLGFVGRPLDPILVNGTPDPTTSSTVLVFVRGGVGHAIPLQDTRLMPVLPQIGKGESLWYGPAYGQFGRMFADGSIALFTATKNMRTDGTGLPVYLHIGSDGSLEFTSPTAGRLIFDATGFHVVTQGGARMHLGAISGAPAPLGSTYCSIQAASTSVDSSAIALGPSGGVSGGAPALATPTLAVVGDLMAAIASAIASRSAGQSAPQAAASLATAAAGILGAAAATVPSGSTAT